MPPLKGLKDASVEGCLSMCLWIQKQCSRTKHAGARRALDVLAGHEDPQDSSLPDILKDEKVSYQFSGNFFI